MQDPNTHAVSIRKYVLAVASLLFIGAFILGESGQARSGQDKMPVEKGGWLIPVKASLPSGVEIISGSSSVNAKHYDGEARWALARQMVIEPRKFAKASLLHLYELESLDAEKLLTVVRKTAVARTDDKRILWHAIFFTMVVPSKQTEERFFGTPLEVKFMASDTPEGLKTQAEAVMSYLKEFAVTSLNHAAPKGSRYFGEDAKIYLAAYQPVEGVESAGMLLTYDPVAAAEKKIR